MKREKVPPPGRREKALSTRRRMLRAARDLFCERGYGGTTMDLIAERADVAVQTLYFTFHTKSAILSETLGAAILGFERWEPGVEAAVAADPRKAFFELQPWLVEIEQAKTQAEAIAVFVRASVPIFERVGALSAVLSAAAVADPQAKAAADVADRRRVECYGFVAELLAKKGKLRPGVSVRRATDVLLTVLSPETYQHLVARRGWSAAECRKWFGEVLRQQLLGPAAAGRRRAAE